MVVLRKQELVPLILASHGEQLPLELTRLLNSLVIVLHHLFLQELFLCQAFSLGLFVLAQFKFALLLRFPFQSLPFFGFSLSAQSGLLVFVLLEHPRLFTHSGSIWRWCWGRGRRRSRLWSCREIWSIARIEQVGWFLVFMKINGGTVMTEEF